MTHSVPHAFALAFHTPQGVVLHSGDFKLDLQPVDGRRTDLARIGALAEDPGIRLLLSDSTNAEEPGFTPSESTVGETLRQLFAARAGRRVIVACFASHIHRVQQIVDAAAANGRQVAFLGRSMLNNVELARSLGLLTIDDDVLVDVDDIGKLDGGRVCVISTGSQGEPMSALSLMAIGENKRRPDRARRRRHDQRPPDPGQRVVGRPGHRPAAPTGRRGHPLRQGAGARERARPPGRAAHAARGDPPRRLRSGARRVPPHGPPRRSWPSPWACRPTRWCCARTATWSRWTRTGCTGTARSRPATSTWTAPSATSATACCGTAGCWPTRASSWWWPTSTSTTPRWSARPG